jgi:hypothetical protein
MASAEPPASASVQSNIFTVPLAGVKVYKVGDEAERQAYIVG